MRKNIFNIISKYESSENLFIADLIREFFDKTHVIDKRDKAFIYNIAYGVIENKRLLEYYIEKISGKKIKNIDKKIQIILKTALYQMAFLDKIPSYAAVNEAVDLTKQILNKRASGFVNAVLRKFTPDLLNKENNLGIKYSYPDWIISYFLSHFGEEKTKEILEYFKKPSPLYLRFKDKESMNNSIKEFKNLNIDFEHTSGFDNVLRVDFSDDIRNLESYKKGYFYIQDINSMKAVEMLDPQKEDKILDCCSAPGGKAIFMAQITGRPEHITAVDNNPKRIKKLRENLDRLNLKDINVICDDVSKISNIKEKYDKILIDAPCSNLGVIGRRIDVKWRMQYVDIKRLANIQQNMLKSVHKLMKKGTILIYSTCTITTEENTENVRNFLAMHNDLKLLDEYLNIPCFKTGDGGYAARIIKISD